MLFVEMFTHWCGCAMYVYGNKVYVLVCSDVYTLSMGVVLCTYVLCMFMGVKCMLCTCVCRCLRAASPHWCPMSWGRGGKGARPTAWMSSSRIWRTQRFPERKPWASKGTSWVCFCFGSLLQHPCLTDSLSVCLCVCKSRFVCNKVFISNEISNVYCCRML